MIEKILPEFSISYDPESDAMYIKLNKKGSYLESQEIEDDIILDLDKDWNLMWIEVLNASKKNIDYLFWWLINNVINFYETSIRKV